MLGLMTRHPRSVGENYGQHLRAAWSIGAPMLAAGFACLVHGLLPFLFERTGSSTVARLHGRIQRRFAAAATGSSTA